MSPGAATREGLRTSAFSLVEILLVMVLLSLIMLALMAVFNSTQAAFRASVTQTDVLEGGRATMDLITSDLRQMYPSGGQSGTNTIIQVSPGPYVPPFNPLLPPQLPPAAANLPTGPVNFWVSAPCDSIDQPLTGTSPALNRTNQLQSVFILSYANNVWKGVGYFVDTNSTDYIYPLYRYDSTWYTLSNRWTALQIFDNFLTNAALPVVETNQNIHHLLNGVVSLTVRAYDTNGFILTNGYGLNQAIVVRNATFYNIQPGQLAMSMLMYSNTLPAAVEVELGVLEDRTLSRAASFGLSSPGNYTNYLALQAGKVHLFRQRVTIPNADPTAYTP